MSLENKFTYEPAVDCTVDAQYVLKDNPSIAVQVCAYGGQTTYAVSHSAGEDDTFAVQFYPEHYSMQKAMREAIELSKTLG